MDVRDSVVGDVTRSPGVSVLVHEEVPGDAEREEVEGGARDDLVGLERDRPHRMDRRERHPGERRRGEADHPGKTARPGVRPDRAPDPEERPGQEHPLERHVDDAAPLAVEPADRRERERRRVAQRRGAERPPHDDAVQVRRRRAGREHAEDDPEHARRDRGAAVSDRSARCRPDAGEDGDQPDQDRQGGRPGRERRQSKPEGEAAQRDPREADLLRTGPAAHARLRRRSHVQRAPRLSPTKSTTSPWMMMVRFSARSGRKIVGSS